MTQSMSPSTTQVTVERYLVAEAFLSPSGVAADGTAVEPMKPAKIPGFIESGFSPLVKAVVDRCLADVAGGGTLGEEGARTAIVLATTFGDAVTADLASQLLSSGKVQNPLLFYQAVPTTILGVVAREYGITGPTTCVSVRGDLRAEALDLADLILADDMIRQVLLVSIELATGPRPQRACEELSAAAAPVSVTQCDTAVAFLLRRTDRAPGVPDSGTPAPAAGESTAPTAMRPAHPQFGAMAGLAQLYLAVRTARESSSPEAVTIDLASARGPRRMRLLL